MKELQQDLFNLLESETSVLAPLDAGPLAKTLIDNLPPVYAAAPQLLKALEAVIYSSDDGTLENGGSILGEKVANLVYAAANAATYRETKATKGE